MFERLNNYVRREVTAEVESVAGVASIIVDKDAVLGAAESASQRLHAVADGMESVQKVVNTVHYGATAATGVGSAVVTAGVLGLVGCSAGPVILAAGSVAAVAAGAVFLGGELLEAKSYAATETYVFGVKNFLPKTFRKESPPLDD